jgi:hypothetical protein
MQWASSNLPREARVAVFGEPRCFYLERDYFWADSFHNTLLDYSRIKTGQDFVQALRQLGATHIFLNTTPATMAELVKCQRIRRSETNGWFLRFPNLMSGVVIRFMKLNCSSSN